MITGSVDRYSTVAAFKSQLLTFTITGLGCNQRLSDHLEYWEFTCWASRPVSRRWAKQDWNKRVKIHPNVFFLLANRLHGGREGSSRGDHWSIFYSMFLYTEPVVMFVLWINPSNMEKQQGTICKGGAWKKSTQERTNKVPFCKCYTMVHSFWSTRHQCSTTDVPAIVLPRNRCWKYHILLTRYSYMNDQSS